MLGIDGDHVNQQDLVIPPGDFLARELRKGLRVDRKFDLAVCLEVGEHLDSRFAALLVRDLTNAADVVLFSAAIPGQGGTHHVNEQWPDYWIERFGRHSFRAVDCVRAAFWDDDDVEYCYAQTSFLFVRNGHRLSARFDAAAAPMPLRVVHPKCLSSTIVLRRVIRNLPPAAKRAAENRIASLVRRSERVQEQQ